MLGKFNGGIFATLAKNIKWRRCLYQCSTRPKMPKLWTRFKSWPDFWSLISFSWIASPSSSFRRKPESRSGWKRQPDSGLRRNDGGLFDSM